jgi:O-antigen/teichoic acid export membrane protein
LYSPTIQAFFAWQMVISFFSTSVVLFFLWRSLPKGVAPSTFKKAHVRRVMRFSMGVSAIGVIGIVLMQSDKIILSRVLTLENFGYYTLAGTVSAGLYMIINPVYNVVFPRFSILVSRGKLEELRQAYHQSAELMSVMVVPLVIVLAMFPSEVLWVWQRNAVIVTSTHSLITLLVIAVGLHGLAHIPWAIQMAYGWTRPAFNINLGAVCLCFPLIYLFTSHYGPIGAASALVIVHFVTLAAMVFMTHRRLLAGGLVRWCLSDIGRPTLAALAIATLFRIGVGCPRSIVPLFFYLAIVTVVTFGVTSSTIPRFRKILGSLVEHSFGVD